MAGRQLEHRHGVDQFLSLTLEAAGRRRHFFHQRSILLCGLVHLRDRLANLGHSQSLFIAGGADLAHDVGDALDGIHNFRHGDAGLVELLEDALGYPACGGVNDEVNFRAALRRLGQLSGEGPLIHV